MYHQWPLRVHYEALIKASNGRLSCTGTFPCACQLFHIYEVNPTAVVKVKVRHAGGGYEIRIKPKSFGFFCTSLIEPSQKGGSIISTLSPKENLALS